MMNDTEALTELPDYLNELNPEQRSAVLHTGSPLLLLAGAGSGKTRVITTKIAYLIREQGIDPHSILAVTFTNKAAREMSERACGIDDRAASAIIRTFHSFGAWFLRRNGHLIDLHSNFVIYDDDDMLSLLSTISPHVPRAELKKYAHHISRAKDFFLGPEDPELDDIDYNPEFRRVYREYEERLKQIGNVDFGDLIRKPVELLRQFPEVRSRFHQRFKVILVDEYQDSNVAQFELLKELCGPDTYLCVVGDDDQSIYRFRGAEVRNILEFPERFPGTTLIRLERNYRSTAPILELASGVVDHNKGRLGKTLISQRGSGKIPTLAFLPDQDAEVQFCAELIEQSVKSGSQERSSSYSDWAILYRMNAQSMGFESEFLRRHIPYKIVGSLKFYEREEVKDALALLSFTVNPRDEVAFRRVANKPARGLGAVALKRIIDYSLSETQDDIGNLLEAARSLQPGLSAKAAKGLQLFIKTIDRAAGMLAGTLALDTENPGNKPDTAAKRKKKNGTGEGSLRGGEGLSLCVVQLVTDSGIADYHSSQDEVAGTQKLANLQELANAASLYPASIEGLSEFLEHIELDRALEQQESNDDSVTLITVHNTKGLEFRKVIMSGMEQGIFPRDDKKDEDLEEERRLFYVGATRAMDELYLSSCAVRRMYGRTMPVQASVFLHEIPESAIRQIGKSALTSTALKQASGTTLFRTSAFKQNKQSSDGRWSLGSRLYHDDYGYGVVVDIRESDDGPLILARFETGREVRFLSKYQSSSFMGVGSDA